jgi:hypothetical protein
MILYPAREINYDDLVKKIANPTIDGTFYNAIKVCHFTNSSKVDNADPCYYIAVLLCPEKLGPLGQVRVIRLCRKP